MQFCRSWITAGLLLAVPAAGAAQPAGPWVEPQDTVAALFSSDAYAWRLFVALNWPADIAGKIADPQKPFGADGPVVWETWRNVRPGSPDAVYRPDGQDPGEWLATPLLVARLQQDFDPEPRQLAMLSSFDGRSTSTGLAPAFDMEAVNSASEVRMNKAAYDFVRANQLYNLDGQLSLVNAGTKNLAFPIAGKEIKAAWRVIDVADKPRYHWAEVTLTDGTKEIWGLTALHIITKDIPNWFWTTFEHIDNKARPPIWLLPSVDRLACPAPPHDCEAVPSGIGLEGTKWANYRLRGTQVDFIDTLGTHTLLANSRLEAIQRRSSCITCHALSARDGLGNTPRFDFLTGPPTADMFSTVAQSPQPLMQLDFVISLTRAARKQP